MSTTIATVAPTTVAPDDNAIDAGLTLAEAVRAVTIGSDVTTESSAVLWSLTREAYARVSAPYVSTIKGKRVLPDTFKPDVMRAMWREAGFSSTPAVSGRDKGTRTFQQYVSRVAAVATNVDHGIDALSSDDTLKEAVQTVKEGKEAATKADARKRASIEYDNYVSWRNGLTPAQQDSLKVTLTLFTAGSGTPYAGVFASLLTA